MNKIVFNYNHNKISAFSPQDRKTEIINIYHLKKKKKNEPKL